MKVLVACECSGIVRDAFRARGHDAWDCDVKCNLSGSQRFHILGDVRRVLGDGWDLVIAHPPCQYLSYAGTAHWKNYGREAKRDAAKDFFRAMFDAPCERVCVENPRGIMNQEYRQPDQVIDPFQFGQPVRKRTCLWLRGVPLLIPTRIVKPAPPAFIDVGGKARHFVDAMSPKNRRERRSMFWPGIACAMADQWGKCDSMASPAKPR